MLNHARLALLSKSTTIASSSYECKAEQAALMACIAICIGDASRSEACLVAKRTMPQLTANKQFVLNMKHDMPSSGRSGSTTALHSSVHIFRQVPCQGAAIFLKILAGLGACTSLHTVEGSRLEAGSCRLGLMSLLTLTDPCNRTRCHCARTAAPRPVIELSHTSSAEVLPMRSPCFWSALIQTSTRNMPFHNGV